MTIKHIYKVAIVALVAGLFFSCQDCSAENEKAAIVLSRGITPYQQAAEGIERGIRRAEGDLVSKKYTLGPNKENVSEIVSEIQSNSTDIVFTIGTAASKYISGKIKDIPIIEAMAYTPADRGKNVSGVYLRVPFKEQFDVIQTLTPSITSLAVIYREEGSGKIINEAEQAAAACGIDLILLKINSESNFDATVENAAQRSEALLMVLDGKLYNKNTAKTLIKFSMRNKYPVIALSQSYVKAGALFSISTPYDANGERAAEMGIKKLRGASRDVTFEPTGKTEIAWNKNASKMFGIRLTSEGKALIDKYY